MTAVVISREGRIRPKAHNTKPSLLASVAAQVSSTCRQFFDEVDIDHARNQIKHLSTTLFFHRRDRIITFRKRAREEFGIKAYWLLLRYEVERYLRNARKELPAFQRLEKFLFAIFLALVTTALLAANTTQESYRAFGLPQTLFSEPTLPQPKSWLSGKANEKGSRTAVLGAHQYAMTAGYTFVGNTSDKEALVENGTLVKLDGRYIELHDVSEPYALPSVALFVNRLGELYASKGCGKLIVTSALRTLAHQGTLANGSNHSVHPTGMSIDLRRDGEQSFCGSWLKKTLLEIEASGRIDMTAENAPRHYHIVVLPNEYNVWLAKQPKGLDPEVKWLAIALHFEGGPKETLDGYRAIAWVIKNRVKSTEYPNTVVEVVAEGAAGRSNGGCQFSFMCDGKSENLETPCVQSSNVLTEYQRSLCITRWNTVVEIAKQVSAETEDLTGGAVLYYARSMEQAPYWARTDIKEGTDDYFGNHRVACSVNRGKDVCEDEEDI